MLGACLLQFGFCGVLEVAENPVEHVHLEEVPVPGNWRTRAAIPEFLPVVQPLPRAFGQVVSARSLWQAH